MSSQNAPAESLTDTELTILCRDYLLAMMRSASTDVIPPREWWEQAKTALEIGAEEPTFQEMVAAVARRLQVESLTRFTASWISSNEPAITANFPSFRHFCRRNAVYIAGMARVEREAQRKNKGFSND